MNRVSNNAGMIAGVGTAIALIALSFLLHEQILDFVVWSGTVALGYPGLDLRTDYLLGVFWALILTPIFIFWPASREERKTLLLLWGARVIVALGISLFYESRYGLDPDGYFHNAINPFFVWKGLRFYQGTENIQHLTWLHLHIIPNSYHAAKVGFSMIGLAAVFIFYQAAMRAWGKQNLTLLYILGLFPSILFWSCLLGKEPIMLFGMALYAYGAVGLCTKRNRKDLLIVVIGSVVAGLIRLWYLPILLMPLVFAMSLSFKKRPSYWVLAGLISLGLVFSLKVVFQYTEVTSISDAERLQEAATGSFEGGKSSFESRKVTGLSSALQTFPIGIFTSLFRPLPFEVSNAFGLMQGLDNLVLLILFFMGFLRTKIREMIIPVVAWAALVVLIWAGFYGLVVSNFGTLARYKLQILPVFLPLLLYMARSRKKRPITQKPTTPCAV